MLQRCRSELPGAWDAQRNAMLAGENASTGEEIVQAAILTELATDLLKLLEVMSGPGGALSALVFWAAGCTAQEGWVWQCNAQRGQKIQCRLPSSQSWPQTCSSCWR